MQKGSDVVERRRSQRKRIKLGVTLELQSSSKPLTVEANLLDISLSGAFVETQALLSTSTPLIMALRLSSAHLQNSFRLCARVMRRTQTGVGVAFLPMPVEMINALSEALSYYEQQHGTGPDAACG